eukprot:353872-Chlamydomonas_euryale.AAC.3
MRVLDLLGAIAQRLRRVLRLNQLCLVFVLEPLRCRAAAHAPDVGVGDRELAMEQVVLGLVVQHLAFERRGLALHAAHALLVLHHRRVIRLLALRVLRLELRKRLTHLAKLLDLWRQPDLRGRSAA